MGVLHETGHALYEGGLPERWRGQPVGEAEGMAVHESQSMIVEIQACRSPTFVRFLAASSPHLRRRPRLRPRQPRALLQPRRARLIRVDADELTYPSTWRCATASSAG
jgi:carboxypeptidase Taq